MEAELDDLYFIQIDPGPVKIGRTGNIKERISHIQCASPYDVELLATVTGGGKHERKIHRHLREVRIRGEWFRWTNIVSDLVDCVKAGGDWEALLSDFDAPPPIADDDWRIGSPLYQGDPRYPQFQWPQS